MSDYLEQLNPVQRDAVTTLDGPVMVVAGPGSGKTRVLTYRIAHMINSGVAPHQILTLTFTNKAAREMVERIEKVVGPHVHDVWAGTFHSVFARILRYEAEHIGFPSSFTIYDTADSKNLVKTIIKELHLNPDRYPHNMVFGRISTAKTSLITPAQYKANQQFIAKDKMNNRGEFWRIYETYVNRCRQAGAMDFDDLLFRLYELFQNNPEVLEKYRSRFTHVLVDEFQDTNFLQYSIIRKLVKYPESNRNICIVGDDAQSIYAFRGATIENILDFEKDFPDVKTFKLEQNYRSTSHIIEAANAVIEHNKRQIPKEIWTDNGEGNKIQVIKAISDNEEGKRVADAILELKNRNHVDNEEIAILYRTNAQSRIFEEQLRRLNVPYRVYGGLSFYQRKEIKDLLAYLRLAINPYDEEALKRVINYPKRGIGAGTLDKYTAYALQNQVPLWDALSLYNGGGRGDQQIKGFVQMMNHAQTKAQTESAYDAAYYIYEKSGIGKELKKDKSIENMSRIENVEALLNGIQEFTENDEATVAITDPENKTLTAYVQNIALLTDQDDKNDPEPKVTLMSVHAAKGLEFDAVLLVGLEEKLFPSFMSLESEKDIDEERRLFYVAITRARKYLYLTLASSRYRFGKLAYNPPSRFLSEIAEVNLANPEALVTTSMPYADSIQSNGNSSRQKSGVSGYFPKKKKHPPLPAHKIPENFAPTAASDIAEGQKVLHLKFGEGKVEQIDGNNDKKVATIYFEGIDNPRRKLMLKFAKLQVLEEA